MKGTHLSNAAIVSQLKEVLAAMEIKNYNRFRIRAYQNAIAILDNLTTSIQDIWEDGRIKDIPGIGDALAQHLDDLFTKGLVEEFAEVKKGLPDGMFALLGIRGIGAKKAFKLATIFKLTDRATAIDTLKQHAEKQDIQKIEGFGEKSEADILEALVQSKKTKNEKPRMLLIKAEQIVERILTYMNTCQHVQKIDALGSFRRRNPTVGDLDFVVATDKPAEVIEHFVNFSEVAEILAKGENKAMVVLSNDAQADLRVSTPEAYGSMLQYNTGSKQHNILLRTYALERGQSLSEYGIKKGDKLIEYADEESFYTAVGLPYIVPELRQGTDEVDLAKKRQLPDLVKLSDIKGDIQSHTTFSDGLNTLDEMATMAESLGYEYLGVSDHAPSIINRGYAEVAKMLSDQRKHFDKVNKRHPNIKLLFGLEVNILADCTLALPDDLLSQLDFALGSIHTAFNQSKDEITARYIMAIENPYITYIGHPLGRLINEREALDINWKELFSAIAYNDKMIEINSQPNRLDMSEDLARVASSKNIKILINTDAHEVSQLNHMKYGLDVARRGFCTKADIANTLPLAEFEKLLKKH